MPRLHPTAGPPFVARYYDGVTDLVSQLGSRNSKPIDGYPQGDSHLALSEELLGIHRPVRDRRLDKCGEDGRIVHTTNTRNAHF